MTKISETGHAKNVANFDALISAVNGLGAVYNPSKQSITPGALATLYREATGALSLVNRCLGSYDLAVAAREEAFLPLSKQATRILNALRASDTSQQVDDTAKSLVLKLQGRRATPKKTKEEKEALKTEGIEAKEISSSQMSFDNRMDSLDKLIQLLSGIPQYAPNEEDLKVSALVVFYQNLKAANTTAVNATVNLNNARITRNEVLYKAGTGLIDTAFAVKAYIKSVFNATSPQYKQISGLAFKTAKL